MNFWVISNLLGMGCYLWIASSEWLPVGEENTTIAGTPEFGDFLAALPIILPCFVILFTFFIANVIALRKKHIKLSVWFILAGLWFIAQLYDVHRSPLFVEESNIPATGNFRVL
jgi:cbb3-type cytochrome oxidase subunit 1